jgi:hypothetical protein
LSIIRIRASREDKTMASPEIAVEDESLKEKMASEQEAADLENRGEIANLPPDPDAHLSAEERALIVRPLCPFPPNFCLFKHVIELQYTDSGWCSGSQTALEAGLDLDPMGG